MKPGEPRDRQEPAPPIDEDQVEQVTRVVLAVLSARDKVERRGTSGLKRAGQFLLDHWPFATFLASVVAVLVAWVLLGASPLYPFKQLAVSDQELDRKNSMFEFQRKIAAHYIDLAEAFLDVGRTKDAAQAYEAALEYDTASVEARMGRVKAEVFNLAASGEYDPEVIARRLELFLRENPERPGAPKDPHALTALANLHYATNEKEKAKAGYEQALAQRPSLALARFGLGNIHLEAGDYDAAIRNLGKAVELSPSTWQYRNNLAYAYVQKSELSTAIEHYQKAWEVDPDALLPFFEAAHTLRLFGDLENALIVQKDLVESLTNEKLTALSKNQGTWSFKAGEQQTVYLNDLPTKTSYAYHGLAATYYLLGRRDEAARHGKKAVEIGDADAESIRTLVAYELAQLQARRPKLTAIIRQFQQEPFALQPAE